jgi:hypothetical protein
MTMPRSVSEILAQAEELARRFESFEPDPNDREGAEALAAVHRAALARAEVEAAIAEAVRRARAAGRSWDAIGERLGTSGEAARQRYGRAA